MKWDKIVRWLLGGRTAVLTCSLLVMLCGGCLKHGEKSSQASSLASNVEPAARSQLKAIYLTAANAVQYDGTLSQPTIKTTVDAAEYVQRLNRYRYGGSNPVATDAFSAELDRRWLASIGKDNRDLTPDLRLMVAGLLRGIANEL